MKITKLDPFTRKLNTIDIPLEGHEEAYEKWLRREGLIQNLLPPPYGRSARVSHDGYNARVLGKVFGDAE